MKEKRILTFLFYFSVMFSQNNLFESEPGYLLIYADTSAVPIYIDGNLIGQTPLDKPIPVLEGIHSISHHNPSIVDPFISYGRIETDKQVFVLAGDTVIVSLNTTLLSKKENQIKNNYKRTNFIGLGLFTIVLWQLWILSN